MKHTRAILVLVCALALPARAPADAFGDMFSVMFRMMLTMMNVMSNAMDNDGWGNSWGGNNWNNLGNWGGLGSWPGMSPWSGMGGWPMLGGMSGLGGWPGMSPWSGMSGWPGMSPWSGLGGVPGMSPWSGLGGVPGMSPWSGLGGWPLNAGGISPWSGLPGGNAWNAPFAGGPLTGDYSPAGMYGYGFPGGWDGPGASPLDGRWYGSSGEILEVRGNSFRLQNAVTSLNGTLRISDNLINLYSPQTGTMTQYTFVGNGADLLLQDASGQVISFHKNPVGSSLNVF
jgi:hypothetical protein